MEKELDPFAQHGTEEERIEVSAHDIMVAIAEGRDIDLLWAKIEGSLDIREIAGRVERDKRGKLIIKGDIQISNSNVSGYIYFNGTSFSGDVDFSGSRFSEDASFMEASFSGILKFDGARFLGDTTSFEKSSFLKLASFSGCRFVWDANFSKCSFSGGALFSESEFRSASFSKSSFTWCVCFTRATFKVPGSFDEVIVYENTVLRGLWNYILYPLFSPIVSLFTGGRICLPRAKVTDILSINTVIVIDAASNPRLKRYIDDEQWINSWRMNPEGRWWRELVFRFWELTSHCGRSIALWLFWFGVVVTGFALGYRSWNLGTGVRWLSGFPGKLYYSLIVFAKLDIADLAGLENWKQCLLLGSERLMGYFMLAALISIFANKFARRS